MANLRLKPRPHHTFAWIIVAALWPVVMLNYLDRQMVATIRVSMRADIASIASDRDFGILMAAFLYVYAAVSPLGGYIADRFSRRSTVICSLFVWSAITWLTGHMHSFSQMLVCRGMMGVSEAFYMPAALALIADYHPGPTRARAIGIHQSGIYAGLILGGLGGYIAQISSWRNCFIWFGLAGIVYSFALLLILRRGPAVRPEREEANSRTTALETLGALFSKPGYWILVAYFTLPATAGWAMKNWLPTFLFDQFHLKEGAAGLSATSYINIASFAGVLCGGLLADRWMRKSHRGRIYTSALGCFMLVPALIGLGAGGTVSAAVLCMIVLGLGWGLFDCNNMPILCQIAQPRRRATGYGLMNCVSISVGAAVTVLLGWMRDQGISFRIAFAVCAAMALLGAGLILLGRRQLDEKTSDIPQIAAGDTNIR